MRLPSRFALLGSLLFIASLLGCAPVDPGEPAPSAVASAPSPSPGPAPAGPSAPAAPGPGSTDPGWKNLVRGAARPGPVDFSDLGVAGVGGSEQGAAGQEQGAGAAGQDQGSAGQDQGPPEEEHPAGSAGAGSTGTNSGEEHGEPPDGAGGSTPEDSDHAGQAGQGPGEQPAEPACEEGEVQGCFSAGHLAVCQAGGYWGGQACPVEAPLCFQGICWASLPETPAP